MSGTLRVALLAALSTAALGCYGGELTESLESIADRDHSGVAGPPDRGALAPVEGIPRGLFGTAHDADALAFPSLSAGYREALFDAEDSATPLHFFVTPQQAGDGLGPLYNQRSCLGCHDSGQDNSVIAEDGGIRGVLFTSSPVARGRRSAQTDQASTSDSSPSSAYTVFGDYHPATGSFDSLELYGGPVRHLGATEDCRADPLPEDNTSGSAIRQLGERAAPSYVGRGLIEAVYDADIEAGTDVDDRISSTSTLTPAPDCSGDCISGRSVLTTEAAAGGAPLLRIGRFGLRGASATLLDMVAAGAQRDVGFTHPFAPHEEQNPYNTGLTCDLSPDPELTDTAILELRDLVRQLAPPELAPALTDLTLDDDDSRDVRAGAALFGVDLDAFTSRMIPGEEPVAFGDDDADRGIAADRQLNCVGCHTPIMVTGSSPARIGAAQLSNRWVPLFSDLLVHDMGSLPLDVDVTDTHPSFKGVSRNLADHALPELNVGAMALDGAEWRTAPLLAFGVVGPPYLHDARVFLNPSAPAYFYYGSRTADEAGLTVEERSVEITGMRAAIRAAIELHDLPQPPDYDLDGLPDYDSCPTLDPNRDWCARTSPFRSEARNVMEKWHALSDAQQARVIAFLLAL